MSHHARQAIPLLLLLVANAGCHASPDPNVLTVSGTIEAVTAELGFKQGGRVAARLVSEGATVKAAQLLAALDDTHLRQDVAQREADLGAAKARLQDLQAGPRPAEVAQAAAAAQRSHSALQAVRTGARAPEVEAARQQLDGARIQAAQLREQGRRVEDLYAVGGISKQERDNQIAAADASQAAARAAAARLKLLQEGSRNEDVAQAQAAARQADAALALVKAGARPGQVAEARARVDLAAANVEAARTRLQDAQLVAPFAGGVLEHHVEAGEIVAAGAPIVSVGQLANTFLQAYVPETDLGRLRLQAAANITVDGLAGRTFPGHVSYISSRAEFTPKSVQTSQERVKLVYRIKIDVPNPDLALKPGMPADAAITLPDKGK